MAGPLISVIRLEAIVARRRVADGQEGLHPCEELAVARAWPVQPAELAAGRSVLASLGLGPLALPGRLGGSPWPPFGPTDSIPCDGPVVAAASRLGPGFRSPGIDIGRAVAWSQSLAREVCQVGGDASEAVRASEAALKAQAIQKDRRPEATAPPIRPDRSAGRQPRSATASHVAGRHPPPRPGPSRVFRHPGGSDVMTNDGRPASPSRSPSPAPWAGSGAPPLTQAPSIRPTWHR